jgi:membrane protease YdiL (CAAX protease family)
MPPRSASGAQIVFLSFAVMLVSLPLSDVISSQLGAPKEMARFIGNSLAFGLGLVAIVSFPSLRRLVFAELSRPIPPESRIEVALVASCKLALVFAFAGGIALWSWLQFGSVLTTDFVSRPRAEMLNEAFSELGMLTQLFMAVLVGPVIEEILFRGLLFQAWERRWGAPIAAVLTSALFASYHPYIVHTFVSGIVYVCVVRRTGSLWGSIVVHAFYNLSIWYPLAGQWLYLDPSQAVRDISTWGLHLACLLITLLILPAYVWMAAMHPYPRRPETA